MNMMKRTWFAVFAQIDLKYAVIKLKDGGSEELEITIGEGNLTYTEARNIEYTLDRGNLDEVREGDQIPMDITIDFVWEYLRSNGGSVPTVEEALKNIGNASAWVSTDADACRPYAIDIEVTYAPVPASCGDQEVITLPDFRYESLDHDLRAGTVSVSGKSNATQATVVRSSQSS